MTCLLPLQCEKLRTDAAFLPGLRAELEALRKRHYAALELMGERDEEVFFSLPNLEFYGNYYLRQFLVFSWK